MFSKLSPEELDQMFLTAYQKGDYRLGQYLRDYSYIKSLDNPILSEDTPLVLYHGSPFTGFTEFQPGALTNSLGSEQLNSTSNFGIWTTDLPEAANEFARTYKGVSSEYTQPTGFWDSLKYKLGIKSPIKRHGVLRVADPVDTSQLLSLDAPEVANLGSRNPNYGKIMTLYGSFLNPKTIDFEGRAWSDAPIAPEPFYVGKSYIGTPITAIDGRINIVPKLAETRYFQNLQEANNYINSFNYPYRNRISENMERVYSGAPDYHVAILQTVPLPKTSSGLFTSAVSQGYDSAIFPNIFDNYDIPMTDYVFNKSRQVKLANPFTFDNNGNLIPLSQRNQWSVDDIRYEDGGTIK